jgi:hypothetical protein
MIYLWGFGVGLELLIFDYEEARRPGIIKRLSVKFKDNIVTVGIPGFMELRR